MSKKDKKYYEKHRKRIRRAQKKYWACNKLRFRNKRMAYNAEYRKLHPEEVLKTARVARLKGYGMTYEEAAKAFSVWREAKECQICKSTNPGRRGLGWNIDHDHNTKKFRGILCHHCNLMLGLAKDSEDILRAAIAYLRESRRGDTNEIFSCA